MQANVFGDGVDVRASWNGATEVARWQVLAGPIARRWRRSTTAGRTGFETKLHIPPAAFVAVRALDRRGRTLGTSAAIAVP